MMNSEPLGLTRLFTGALLTASLIAAGHWFPSAETHKRYGVMRRIAAYTYGCGAILAGLAVADGKAARKATVITVTAGAMTLAVYGVDKALNLLVLGNGRQS